MSDKNIEDDLFSNLSFAPSDKASDAVKCEKSGTLDEVADYIWDECKKRYGDDFYLSPSFMYEEDKNGIYHCLMDKIYKQDVFYLQLGKPELYSLKISSRSAVRYTLNNPTYYDLFKVLEDHYRSIGCPPTDHRFFEVLELMGFSRDGSGLKIYAAFMGS